MRKEVFEIKNDAEFEMLALSIFNYQIKKNPIYAAYATLILKGENPKNIFEIPFLPISFFKTEQIICQGRPVEKVFLSSGTTGNQSKHLVSDISLYRNSYLRSFELFYGDIKEYCILSLLPNYREQEGSSLIYMVDDLISQSKHEQSGFYLNNYEQLLVTLKKLEKEKQKTILFGVSHALLDLAEQFPQKLKHTIIIETGGTKGKRKEMLKEELHQKLKAAFALDEIHSEYGMTELLSQSYSDRNGVFKSPPWKKILIRDINDPLTMIGENNTGGINIIDLANIYSCPFIATKDLGKTFEDGTFKILGRFNNADLRGCNLLVQ
ncbi:MAG: acyl transferase [Flavobacteriales bacterium]|nr:acyl transferase [Flavobacteriales bacterium]